jgi:hypothetical protein
MILRNAKRVQSKPIRDRPPADRHQHDIGRKEGRLAAARRRDADG